MPQPVYAILSDLILVVHFAFVAFILGGFLLIWIGYFCGWAFIHNFPFRILHFCAMAFVFLEAIIGMVCPLTAWENELRIRAGQVGRYEQSFIEHWLGRVLFYEASEQAFTIIYAIFFLVLILTMVIIPVRRRLPGR